MIVLKTYLKTWRSLILPHIVDAFADPRSVFERVATRTQLRNLASYLQVMIARNDWQLVVEDAFFRERVTRVGFYWYHPDCYSARSQTFTSK